MSRAHVLVRCEYEYECQKDGDVRSLTSDEAMRSTLHLPPSYGLSRNRYNIFNSHPFQTAVNTHLKPITNYRMTTTSSQGSHPTRAPSASEQKLIDDVLKLYQLQPSEQAYSHYSEDAVFRKYHSV